ncbi:MAG: Hsp20/alpha crystallin family protein [Leptolinea sp.]|jgi:HSP20 family protein|nr:Hsp20/alpha crystallin family protein [Leptolinea sp.]
MFEYPKSGMFNLRVSYHSNLYRPPVDVVESPEDFLVRIEIAGVEEKDFSIDFDRNRLLVSGIRHDPYKNRSFHQMEIHFGEFQIEILINQPINRDEIKAEYRNGFLEVSLPKAAPHDIFIKDKDA